MAPPLPTIRPAARGDLPRLVALLAQMSLGPERREGEGPDAGHAAAFDAISADPRQLLLVAELAGEVVGTYTFLWFANLSYRGRPIAQVESVVVDASLRGRGIGLAMMEDAIARAKALSCVRLQLTSHLSRKDAHRFYERLGFVATHAGMKLALA